MVVIRPTPSDKGSLRCHKSLTTLCHNYYNYIPSDWSRAWRALVFHRNCALLSHGHEYQLVSVSSNIAHSQDTLTIIWKKYSQSPTNNSELYYTMTAMQPKRSVAPLKLRNYPSRFLILAQYRASYMLSRELEIQFAMWTDLANCFLLSINKHICYNPLVIAQEYIYIGGIYYMIYRNALYYMCMCGS